jgi:hypothetical protein
MPYPSVIGIIGFGVVVACARLFYLYGSEQRSFGWIWPVLSFAIWGFIVLFLQGGLLIQFLGQLALFVLITIINMSCKHTAQIIK